MEKIEDEARRTEPMSGTHVATILPTLPFPRNRRGSIRCCGSSGRDRRDEAQWPLKAAVSGVTELLRLFLSPHNRQREQKLPLIRDVEDVISILRSDYDQAYFLTGKFTPEIYSESCLFEDPTIKFSGRERYSQNLALLIPFFKSPSLVLENIQKIIDDEKKLIIAEWKLRTFLRLPWAPLISIGGTTTYELDENFLIIRHTERWDMSALQAVGQIFVPSASSD